MWIFTKYGFFSVVKKRDESSGRLAYHIRARRRGDLENLVDLELDDRNRTALIASRRRLKIVDTPAGDYCSRLIVDAWNWARISTLLMVSIDYDNFKNEIGDTPDQHDKLAAYHDVWHRLVVYQQGRSPMHAPGDATIFENPELHGDPRPARL